MNFLKYRIPFGLVLCFMLFSSQQCKENGEGASGMASAAQKEMFCKKWNLEKSEENGAVKVFRPEGYDLPPRRGRHAYEFKEDGTAFFYTFGPTDRPVTHQGTWAPQGNNKVLLSLGEAGKLEMEVVELTPDKLAVKTLSSRN